MQSPMNSEHVRSEPAEASERRGHPTVLHAVFGQPERHTVAMEVLLPLTMDLKLDLELPVPEVAGLGGGGGRG